MGGVCRGGGVAEAPLVCVCGVFVVLWVGNYSSCLARNTDSLTRLPSPGNSASCLIVLNRFILCLNDVVWTQKFATKNLTGGESGKLLSFQN